MRSDDDDDDDELQLLACLPSGVFEYFWKRSDTTCITINRGM